MNNITDDISNLAETGSAAGNGAGTQVIDTASPKSTGAYAKKRMLFIAVVAMQVSSFLAVGAAKAYTLTTGTVVTLKTMPVDPRDPFRGDYVNLSYEGFPEAWSFSNKTSEDSEYYLLLQKDDPYWHIVGRSETRPRAGANQIVMKGKINRHANFGGPQGYNFGIERYYVKEGSGLVLEQQKALKVEVAVDNFNNAVIKSVTVP